MTTGSAGIGLIVQARMGSQRLPGKVLRPLSGAPLLQYVLDRAGRVERAAHVVVSTSTEPADDPIAAFCAECGIACFRGAESNVARRFLDTLDHYGFDAFVRVCADSPLLDVGLINLGLEIFHTHQFEIVTNNLERTFPRGQTIEILSSEAYRRGYARMQTPDHAEHVTRFFYENAPDFLIHNFAAEEDCSALNLAVDTQEDLDRVTEMITQMDRPHWQYSWREIVADFCTVLS